ncbi:hypothetical protein ERO13_D04G167250v2 [Gossypium hirsutum]|nr:hypothetical protein ERO13_D04G167250v2 [Gossypium hirsutum]
MAGPKYPCPYPPLAYQGPPVVPPPPHYAAPPPPATAPPLRAGFLEGCITALRCCYLIGECCGDSSIDTCCYLIGECCGDSSINAASGLPL